MAPSASHETYNGRAVYLGGGKLTRQIKSKTLRLTLGFALIFCSQARSQEKPLEWKFPSPNTSGVEGLCIDLVSERDAIWQKYPDKTPEEALWFGLFTRLRDYFDINPTRGLTPGADGESFIASCKRNIHEMIGLNMEGYFDLLGIAQNYIDEALQLRPNI
jgi:hypothetical protein